MFLKKKEHRKLTILSHLSEQHSPLRQDSLLAQLNITLAVLKRDIQSLNEDFNAVKEFSTIEILVKNKSLYLINPTPFKPQFLIKKIRLNYHLNNIHFQIFKELFASSEVSLTDLAKKLAISLPYLYKLLYISNNFLATFDLKIDYSKKLDRILITGSSTNIRLFHTHFFWDITQGLNWLFTEISSDEILAYIPKNEIQPFLNLSAAKQSRYLHSIATIHQLFPIVDFNLRLDSKLRETIMVFMTINDLSYSLDRLLNDNFDLDDSDNKLVNERLFLNYSLRVFSSFRDSPLIQKQIGKKLHQVDNELIHYCKKLIHSLGIAFPEIKQLPKYNDIYETCLYFFSLFFTNIFYVRYASGNYQMTYENNALPSSYHSQIFKRVKVLFDTFLLEVPLTSEAHNFLLDSQKTAAYLLIYNIISSFELAPTRVFLGFSKNLFEEEFIRSELLKLFGKENIIIVESMNNANIIISDFYEHPYQKDNFFYFDDITNKHNWHELYTFIHNYQLNK